MSETRKGIMGRFYWKTLDVMGVIHTLGAGKSILLRDYDSEDSRMIFQVFSPYIKVRTAGHEEIRLFAPESDCIIVDELQENRLSIVEQFAFGQLYEYFENVTLENIFGKLRFKTNFEVVERRKFDFTEALVCFDSGKEMICVTESGSYVGFMDEHACKDAFSQNCIPKISPLYLERKDTGCIENEKNEAAKLLKDNFLLRVPVLHNGTPVGFYDMVNNICEEIDLHFINPEDVSRLLQAFPRIMLTSVFCNKGNLFNKLENKPVILDSDKMKRIYDGSIDMLICCGEPIGNLPIPCYGIEQIILDILSIKAAEKAESEGASLNVMYIPKKKQVPGWQYRVGGVTKERDYAVTYRDGNMAIKQHDMEKYSYVVLKNGVYSYEDIKTETLTLKDGRREVPDGMQRDGNGPCIYLIGYCPLLGAFSKDENIIASELLKILRKNNCDYGVVQYVCPPMNSAIQQVRSEINTYITMLNITFSKGDVICITGLNSFNSITGVPSGVHIYFSAEAFMFSREENCFSDNSLSHLTSTGNRVFAEWLYKEVIHDLLGK